MKNRYSSYFFSSLLHRFPNPSISQAFPSLPPELVEYTKEIVETTSPPEAWLRKYDSMESFIHPSWKTELLAFLPASLQKKKEPLKDLSPTLSRFLMNYALMQSSFKDLPQPAEFATSEMSYLLEVSEAGLLDLMDLLSIFFVVEPFRLILDKARFKRFSTLLSPLQKKFLSFLLLNPRSIPFEAIDMKKLLSYKTDEIAKNALFEKGLSVFSHALYGEKEDLISLLCYKMDMNLGKRILELSRMTTKESTRARTALKFVFNFLKNHKKV